MAEATKLTLDDVLDRYDFMAEARCVDGFYEITGNRESVKCAWSTWGWCDISFEVVSEGLVGWSDYNHFIRADTGAGTIGFMARLKR